MTTDSPPPALEKRFDAAAIEKKWREKWRASEVFKANPDNVGPGKKEPFVIIMPPPNVTGNLHLGHAMRGAIEDCLIRWKRMKGFEALYLPGLDHAGIATQMMVSKELEKQGIKRIELGREKFLEKVWEWKAQYGSQILEQFERLGISCDWSRLVFTLDPGPSRAVRHAFKTLYDQGSLYHGEYLINWCPSCRTALSDLETDHIEKEGSLWHITYPFADGPQEGLAGLTVATTRPETMLGDTAVAVHPDDPRYKKFIGKKVKLPLMNREIPVVADSFVDPKFGTGAVKLTPAHDPNDFEAGKRLNLPSINVMNEDATINENGGEFKGLERFMARKRVVAALEAGGFLAKIEKHKNQVGICERCKTVVEPRLSTQWFIKMKPLAEKALAAHRKDFNFTPDHWGKVFDNWLGEIHDWCISRQLWWGHRIPAWYCADGHITVSEDEAGPNACATCNAAALKQDEDVLDTWFSSQLWPMSTLGWPEKTADFEKFYPGQVMETGYDILFFWVARMLMAGLHFDGRAPFKDIYLSGLIRDKHGKKMSKTAGNTIDPLETIDKFGADALRFSLIIASVGGTDVTVDMSRIEGYRDFATKLWNASRFLLMNLDDSIPEDTETRRGARRAPMPEHLNSPVNRWLLEEFEKTAQAVNQSLDAFDFHSAANAIYHFVWDIYCDWGIELSKTALRETGAAKDESAATLLHILKGVLGLLHPMMPFITEEIYAALPGDKNDFLAASVYPAGGATSGNESARFAKLIELITAIRNLRATANIPPAELAELEIRCEEPALAQFLQSIQPQWQGLAKLGTIAWLKPASPFSPGLPGVGGGIHFNLLMVKAELSAEEIARLENDRKKLLLEKEKLEKQLAAFSEKTPAAVKEKTAAAIADAARKLEIIALRMNG
jgi:valyl-tRNA synthetase